jgi:hypothetical protein
MEFKEFGLVCLMEKWLKFMNIKRQYILPNCTLILEGLEDSDLENADILDGQFPMSILINAECNFLVSNQTLSGGSVFLQNLSRAASNYAQSFLSGLPHPQKENTEYPQVAIHKTDNHLHRLTFKPETDADLEPTEINLTTIELFDLVDAIDRFHADRNTLPSMSLELQSVSKRYRQPEQPLAERLTPIGIGFASLAMAAGAFFVIPPPEVRSPDTNPVNSTIKTKPATTKNAAPVPPTSPKNNSLNKTKTIPQNTAQ